MTRFPGQAAAPARVESLPLLLRQATVATDRLLTGLAAGGAAGELDGLGASAVHILALVRTGRPVTALAESLRISPQAAGRVVARLEQLGLLWRYPHGLDTRVRIVELTDEGADAVAAIHDALENALHVLGDVLAPERIAPLLQDLEALAEIGEERHPWDRR